MSKVIVGKRLRNALQQIQDAIAREGAGKGRREMEDAIDSITVRRVIVDRSLADMARNGLLFAAHGSKKGVRL